MTRTLRPARKQLKKKKKKKTEPEGRKVYFRVHGDFITGLARNLWAEEDVGKAIRLLVQGVTNMDEGTAVMICTGHFKLDGVNDLQLLPDNAKEDGRGLPLLSLRETANRLRQKIADARNNERMAIKNLAKFAEAWGGPIAEKVVQWNVLRQIEEQVEKTLPAPNPVPERLFKDWVCGWVDPDGRFYGCSYMEHVSIAERLGATEYQLEKAGWVKISDAFTLMGERPPTDMQKKTVANHHRVHDRELPFWLEDD